MLLLQRHIRRALIWVRCSLQRVVEQALGWNFRIMGAKIPTRKIRRYSIITLFIYLFMYSVQYPTLLFASFSPSLPSPPRTTHVSSPQSSWPTTNAPPLSIAVFSASNRNPGKRLRSSSSFVCLFRPPCYRFERLDLHCHA